LKNFLENGGSILYLSAEGGDSKTGTNFNYFLEEYGIEVNSDSVVRSTFYKYFHPKV
jgi:intraflagellar transport protein 52